MKNQQLLFIFSHSPDESLAWDAWDAAMTAGLLDQSVAILFTGSGLIQLHDPAIREKIDSLGEFLPLRLCADQEPAHKPGDGSLDNALEIIPQDILPCFMAGFDGILSF